MALVHGRFVKPDVVQLNIELTQPVKQGDQTGEVVEQMVQASQPDLGRWPEPVGVPLIEAVLDSLIQQLLKGRYDFYFRSKATSTVHFVQPSAVAKLVYDPSVTAC
ncbi:MAG: hypothetical protein GWP91_16170 [Rhodobacterales bacterium]|nr:hypothetical protein [Rhodobacterales bacterium]